MVALNGRRNWWPKRCHDTRHYLGEVSCVYNAIHRNRNSVTSACYIVRGCSISFPFLSLSFFLSSLSFFPPSSHFYSLTRTRNGMELYIFLSDEEIRGELTRIRSNSWNGRFCFGAEYVEILLSNRFDENYLGFRSRNERANLFSCNFAYWYLYIRN